MFNDYAYNNNGEKFYLNDRVYYDNCAYIVKGFKVKDFFNGCPQLFLYLVRECLIAEGSHSGRWVYIEKCSKVREESDLDPWKELFEEIAYFGRDYCMDIFGNDFLHEMDVRMEEWMRRKDIIEYYDED